jgi:hypothetical protein
MQETDAGGKAYHCEFFVLLRPYSILNDQKKKNHQTLHGRIVLYHGTPLETESHPTNKPAFPTNGKQKAFLVRSN